MKELRTSVRIQSVIVRHHKVKDIAVRIARPHPTRLLAGAAIQSAKQAQASRAPKLLLSLEIRLSAGA